MCGITRKVVNARPAFHWNGSHNTLQVSVFCGCPPSWAFPSWASGLSVCLSLKKKRPNDLDIAHDDIAIVDLGDLLDAFRKFDWISHCRQSKLSGG